MKNEKKTAAKQAETVTISRAEYEELRQHRAETAVHVIAMSVLVLNLRKIQCAFLQFLTYLLAVFPSKEKWAIVQ